MDTGNIMTNADITAMLSTNSKGVGGQSCRVETVVQEPQTNNDQYCVFNINSGGILDKSSRLKISVFKNGAEGQLPPITGVLAMIESAELKTSQGITIASTHDFGHIATCRQCFVNEEQRKNRNSKVIGTYNVYDYHSDGSVQLVDRPDNLQVGNGIANLCEYTISLEMLFPELFPFMLPVFCIADNLQLHITWSDKEATTGGRVVPQNNTTAGADYAGLHQILIDNNSVQFVADHLYFSPMVMNKILQSTQGKSGFNVPYGDYQLVKAQFNTPNAGMARNNNPGATTSGDNSITETKQFNLGLSGLSIRYMLMMLQNQGINSVPTTVALGDKGAEQRIIGKFGSSGTLNTNKDKLQLVVNNINYFQKAVDTPSRFYNNLVDVFGVEPHIPWGVYTNEQNYYQDATAINTAGNSSKLHEVSSTALVRTGGFYRTDVPEKLLGGCLNYKGINFSFAHNNSVGTGLRIGETPVELSFDYNWSFENRLGARLLRIYTCVERVMNIHNGNITVDFS